MNWKTVAFLLFVAVLLGSMVGCNSVDFKKKALAAEIKVYGLDAEIPSMPGGEGSIARVRLGVVTSRYVSAPDGGEAEIKTEYDDINFWTLSGSAKTSMKVSNTK